MSCREKRPGQLSWPFFVPCGLSMFSQLTDFVRRVEALERGFEKTAGREENDKKRTSGAEALVGVSFTARLKSCPDTKHQSRDSEGSLPLDGSWWFGRDVV